MTMINLNSMDLRGEERKMVREIEHRLAKDLYGYLSGERSEGVKWNDTVTHLMEVVHYLYQSDMMKDANGMSLTKKAIAQMACDVFGVTMPRNIGTYLTRIRNIKGQKAMSLLDMNFYQVCHNGEYFGLGRSVG